MGQCWLVYRLENRVNNQLKSVRSLYHYVVGKHRYLYERIVWNQNHNPCMKTALRVSECLIVNTYSLVKHILFITYVTITVH